jgi:hypothetical protein
MAPKMYFARSETRKAIREIMKAETGARDHPNHQI